MRMRRTIDISQRHELTLVNSCRLRGYYYHHSGLLLRETTGMTQEVRDLFVLAAQEYRATEKYYPDDDVHNICEYP